MRIRAWSLLAGVSLLLILAPTTWAASTASAVISNGVIALGVSADGGLSEGTTGIQFVANGAEGMSPNCACGPTLTIGRDPLTTSLESFFYEATSASTSVLIEDSATGGSLRMIDQFQPSASATNLYEVVVTVQNLGSATVDPTYTRPLAWANTPASQFQLDLGPIAPGGTVVFREYFGAGAALTDATTGFGLEGASLVSPYVGPISFAFGYGLGASPTASTTGAGGGGGGGGGGGAPAGTSSTSAVNAPSGGTTTSVGTGTPPSGGAITSGTTPPLANTAPVGGTIPFSGGPTSGGPVGGTASDGGPVGGTTSGGGPVGGTTSSGGAPTTGGGTSSGTGPLLGLLPPVGNAPNNLAGSGPVVGPNFAATPELDSLSLMASGLAGVGGFALMRWRARKPKRDSDSSR